MITIDYQIAVKDTAGLPEEADLVKYAETAAQDLVANAAMTVRIAEEDESHALNMEYRHVDRPTNVLSFPYELPEDLPPEALADFPENYLGDLVICKSVVEREAQEQNKTPEEHWAHMVVHGTLHLLGFDHLTDAEAQEMETRETAALKELGFPDPYRDDEE
jgi:probable rRNA maturation factor